MNDKEFVMKEQIVTLQKEITELVQNLQAEYSGKINPKFNYKRMKEHIEQCPPPAFFFADFWKIAKMLVFYV